jgi:hypothetical protein
MSLYQQHPGYASNQYGSGGGYSAQHQPASAASPYGAQQQYAPDPNEFRTWFNSHLATLTVNNKAIIHSIAFIAREHAQTFGSVIAQCIEQHIRRVSHVSLCCYVTWRVDGLDVVITLFFHVLVFCSSCMLQHKSVLLGKDSQPVGSDYHPVNNGDTLTSSRSSLRLPS